MDSKIPPHSDQDEMIVLGSMLISKEAVEQAVDLLAAGDFYDSRNKTVFETIQDLYSRNQTPDLEAVGSELRSRGKMVDVGGDHLVGLMNEVGTAAHVVFHAEKVRDYSILRSLTERCTEIVGACYEHSDPPKAILERAEKYIHAISEKGVRSQMSLLKESVYEAMDNLDTLSQKKSKTTGLETGFPGLDLMTSGLQPGNMVVIAARPGMGKTSLALDIARHNAGKGIPVAFFSLEMTRVEIANRLVSSLSGIPLYQIRTGNLSAGNLSIALKTFEKMAEMPMYLNCPSSDMSALNIRSFCRRLAGQMTRAGKHLGLIVVDYLQLLSDKSKRHDTRQSEVADISRSLKGIALDLNVPILALSQLNRQTEEAGRMGRPRLSDLRESGSIEQDSDLVMFIYREALYKAGAAEEDKAKTKLIIAKHRNGALGEIDLYFAKETTRFVSVETEANL